MKNFGTALVPYIYSPYIPLQVTTLGRYHKRVRKEIGKAYAKLIRKLIPNEIKEKQLRIRYQRNIKDTYSFYLSIREKNVHKSNVNFDIHTFEFDKNNVIISKRTMEREKDCRWYPTCERKDETFDISDPDFVDKVRKFFGEPNG